MTSIGGSAPSYDLNGKVTNDFLHSYSWDAYGLPVTIDGEGITYDALGRMVEQNRSGTYTEIVYAPSGEKLAAMNGQTLQKAFVSLPGGATSIYTSGGLDHYRHSDWLGSARLATTPGRTVYGDVAYAPFGEPYAQSGNADLSFTGMNQDAVSNAYDFPAREYGIQGRWPSPDPAGLAAVDLANPQSWNRYAYVMDNPLAVTDPTGMWSTLTDGGGGGGRSCDPFFGCCNYFIGCCDPSSAAIPSSSAGAEEEGDGGIILLPRRPHHPHQAAMETVSIFLESHSYPARYLVSPSGSSVGSSPAPPSILGTLTSPSIRNGFQNRKSHSQRAVGRLKGPALVVSSIRIWGG